MIRARRPRIRAIDPEANVGVCRAVAPALARHRIASRPRLVTSARCGPRARLNLQLLAVAPAWVRGRAASGKFCWKKGAGPPRALHSAATEERRRHLGARRCRLGLFELGRARSWASGAGGSVCIQHVLDRALRDGYTLAD